MQLSFVVIAYNEAPNLPACVDAIVAQHGLPPRYEIVLVDDGSADDTLATMRCLAERHPQVRVVGLPTNHGRGAARAAGVAASTGEAVAFVDADITLPRDWLTRCAECLQDHDACGGVAVPDGDVAYVHRTRRLRPRAGHRPPYAITGNNVLFTRQVLDTTPFDAAKRNGEDVDVVHRMTQAGFTAHTVAGLTVEHHEAKSYAGTLGWLFESGVGATHQFYEHRAVRLPDLAFLGFVVVTVGSLVLAGLSVIPWWAAAAAVVLFLLASSLLHLHGRFLLRRTPLRSLAAVSVNAGFLLAYYAGRTVGLLTPPRKASRAGRQR